MERQNNKDIKAFSKLSERTTAQAVLFSVDSAECPACDLLLPDRVSGYSTVSKSGWVTLMQPLPYQNVSSERDKRIGKNIVIKKETKKKKHTESTLDAVYRVKTQLQLLDRLTELCAPAAEAGCQVRKRDVLLERHRSRFRNRYAASAVVDVSGDLHNHSTGVSSPLKTKYYLVKRGISEYLNVARWRNSHMHYAHVAPVTYSLSVKGSSSCARCSIFKTLTSAWIWTWLDYSTAEVSSSTKLHGLEALNEFALRVCSLLESSMTFGQKANRPRGRPHGTEDSSTLAEVTEKTSMNQ